MKMETAIDIRDERSENSFYFQEESKKRYLDDLINAFNMLIQENVLPDKLPCLKETLDAFYLKDGFNVSPKSGIVTKDEFYNLRSDIPFLGDQESRIETKEFKGHLFDIFEFPRIENIWMRYLISFEKIPERAKKGLMNIDYSHLKDPEHAWNLLKELKLKPWRVEKHTLGPFIADYLPGADYGLVSKTVQKHKDSWLLVYQNECFVETQSSHGLHKYFGIIPKSTTIKENVCHTYFACSEDIKKDLEIIHPKKNILVYSGN